MVTFMSVKNKVVIFHEIQQRFNENNCSVEHDMNMSVSNIIT